MNITRKDFLRSLVGGATGIVAIGFIAGCGGDDGGSEAPDAAGASCTTPTSSISSNHGHVFAITLADVQAGTAKSYDIMGTSPHSHSVMVNATQMGQIKNGQTLNIDSSVGAGHSHTVTIMCVS